MYRDQDNDNNKQEDDDVMNPITKASWYAAEIFGKVFKDENRINEINKSSPSSSTTAPDLDLSLPPTSLQDTYERIQYDINRNYFLSGVVDRYIYDVDCTFADPFVSFNGRDRFIENLSNLGSFITNYSCKPLNYEENGSIVETKVRSLLLLSEASSPYENSPNKF